MTGKRAAASVSWLTPERRAWLYRVLTAAGLLAAFYGLVSEEALPLWLGLAGTTLGTGTAAAYTPARKVAGDDPND